MPCFIAKFSNGATIYLLCLGEAVALKCPHLQQCFNVASNTTLHS